MTARGGDALARADAVLRKHGKTFAWARRFLGARHARRATQLYAFCRYLDDVADEGGDSAAAEAALLSVRGDLERGASDDPFVAAVLEQFGGRRPGRAAAMALVDGVLRDLEPVAFDSERELMRYCYRVAGTVGVMMCEALEQPEPAATPFAIDLGMAMQLTNIARDVHEDAQRGRRYVPGPMVDGAGAASLFTLDEATRAATLRARRALLQRAERYYESGRRGLAYLPLRARFAILIAAENYRAIGARVRALGAAAEVRAFVSPAAKIWITTRALAGAVLRPSFWRRPSRHDPRLHEHLGGLDGAQVEEGARA